MLLAIDVTLVGIVNSKALAIIFLLLVIPSFVFSFRRVFESVWRHMANWLLEFSLLLLAILTVIEEVSGTEDYLGEIFIIFFTVIQFIVLILVIIDLIVMICRLCAKMMKKKSKVAPALTNESMQQLNQTYGEETL